MRRSLSTLVVVFALTALVIWIRRRDDAVEVERVVERALAAATVRLSRVSPVEGEHLGLSLAPAGDLDDDGVADLAVGAPGATVDGVAGAGRVIVVSGADGRVLLRLAGATEQGRFGWSLAAVGDRDGDGRDDLAVGETGGGPVRPTGPGRPPTTADPQGEDAPTAPVGRVTVHGGRDGAPLLVIEGARGGEKTGWVVATAGDLDGDGVGDLALGVPDGGGTEKGLATGVVRFVSGADGTTLHAVAGDARSAFGWSLARVGAHDGVERLAVGAPDAPVRDIARTGKVRLVDARSGATVRVLRGRIVEGAWGVALAGPGDLNGDGIPDLVVGAHSAGMGRAGEVTAISGRDGLVLWTQHGPRIDAFQGWSVAGLGDVDGDGAPDVAIGVPRGGGRPGPDAPGLVRVVSGRDGTLIREHEGPGPAAKLGWLVAGPGDLDGDGVPDVAASAPDATVAGVATAGQVLAWSGRDGRLILRVVGD